MVRRKDQVSLILGVFRKHVVVPSCAPCAYWSAILGQEKVFSGCNAPRSTIAGTPNSTIAALLSGY